MSAGCCAGDHDSVDAADVDGDGDVDLLSASVVDDKIAWYPQKSTDPADAYTDGDGFDDGAEVAAGTDPLDDQSFPASPAVPAIPLGGLLALAGALRLAGSLRVHHAMRRG